MEASLQVGGSLTVVLKSPPEGPASLLVTKGSGSFTEAELRGIEEVVRTAYLGRQDESNTR